MNKTGKVARQWINTRTEWFRLHPADHYDCYICGKYMLRNVTLLDHVKSRTRHPELRYDLNNLAPICHPCNEGKGSLDLDEYLQRRKEFNGWD